MNLRNYLICLAAVKAVNKQDKHMGVAILYPLENIGSTQQPINLNGDLWERNKRIKVLRE